MHKIMLLNPKGGCGKTTIATTLACYFAGEGYHTALMDFDPQGSSSRWLKIRSTDQPLIKSIDAARQKMGVTRSWQLYSGNETEIMIMDTPAGISGGKLVDLYHQADSILVPVMPSVIDFYAIEGFVDELTRLFKQGRQSKRLAVIGNRVRLKTRAYQAIEQLIAQAGIPLLTSLRDTQNYSVAMESGLGICELKPGVSAKDIAQWQPVLEWLQEEMPRRNLDLFRDRSVSPPAVLAVS